MSLQITVSVEIGQGAVVAVAEIWLCDLYLLMVSDKSHSNQRELTMRCIRHDVIKMFYRWILKSCCGVPEPDYT